jgi:hypothetical protein
MRRPRTLRRVFSAGLCCTLVCAASARGTEVRVSDSRLFIEAAGDGTNVIDVRIVGLFYVVDDATSNITSGTNCGNLGARRAVCVGSIMSVDVRADGGSDLIGLRDVMVPTHVDGGGGDDLLETGGGRDVLVGGDGDDALVSNGNEDSLVGERGDDLLMGGSGSDNLKAGDGDDTLVGGDSSGDVLSGGLGEDLLRAGSEGSGVLDGGAGADVLVARAGDNRLDPGAGANTILGIDPSTDTLRCSARDRARDRSGRAVEDCSAVPKRTKVPRRWPPRTDAGRASKLPGSHSNVFARPRVREDATYYTVRVKARRTGAKKVCIRLYNVAERLVARFTKKVKLKYATSYTRPRIPRSSYYGRPYRGPCK